MAKKRRTIEELRAYDKAYGRKLTKSRQFKLSVEPAIILAIISTMMWMRPALSIVFFVIGLMYGYFRIMPRQVKVQYEADALYQRHRAIGILTSAMAGNSSAPAYKVLSAVASASEGELKDDFIKLTAAVVRIESARSVHKAFLEIIDKYKSDSYFVQFMEQVESYTLDSNLDVETLEMLNDMHNKVYEDSIAFGRVREQALTETRTMLGVVIGLGVGMEAVGVKMATYKYFMQYFWHGLTGWITGALMIIILSIILMRFYTRYFDDKITEY